MLDGVNELLSGKACCKLKKIESIYLTNTTMAESIGELSLNISTKNDYLKVIEQKPSIYLLITLFIG